MKLVFSSCDHQIDYGIDNYIRFMMNTEKAEKENECVSHPRMNNV